MASLKHAITNQNVGRVLTSKILKIVELFTKQVSMIVRNMPNLVIYSCVLL